MACTSPAFTVRSRPLRISLPSISTCKFLISRSVIPKDSSISFVRLPVAPTPAPAPFALGLAAADDRENGEGDDVEREQRRQLPITFLRQPQKQRNRQHRQHGPRSEE